MNYRKLLRGGREYARWRRAVVQQQRMRKAAHNAPTTDPANPQHFDGTGGAR